MTAKLTARQKAILEYIRVHQPVSNAQLSERFECAPATMTVHLMFIARAGMCRSVGRAARARWYADKPFAKPPPPAPSIEQVSSIWHYAARCARAA